MLSEEEQREIKRAYHREHYRKNQEKIRERNRKWLKNNPRTTPEHKEKTRLKSARNRIKFAEKHKAGYQVRYAVKMGTLKKYPCQVCGEVKSEGHHEDYSKPLEVIWLCSLHHRHIHYNLLKRTDIKEPPY